MLEDIGEREKNCLFRFRLPFAHEISLIGLFFLLSVSIRYNRISTARSSVQPKRMLEIFQSQRSKRTVSVEHRSLLMY